jgi:lipopolysaccharide/colanic/teichoic acid biosynthesis glycosyltransferase
MMTSQLALDHKQAQGTAAQRPLGQNILAFLVAQSELVLVDKALRVRSSQRCEIYIVDGGEGATAEPVPAPLRRPRAVPTAAAIAACRTDLLVIGEGAGGLPREVAFAVIELALRGASVCSLADFLAMPGLRPDPVPGPRMVDHLVSALAADPRGQRVKRVVDLLLGSLGLVLALPLFALVAAAIKLESPGRVFFVQERLGRLRVPFPCLKFRTMREDAEQGTGPVWASADDPRITRLGRFLRRSRLDELPQLINVVRGEMSIVGARPIRRHFADQLVEQVPFYNIRFIEKPGLTGWAQINYNYASTITAQIEKFYHDYHYLRNWSIWLDLQIMIRTAGVMIRMKGT